MKRIILTLLFFPAFIFANSQELPSKKEILSAMKTVNNYWISQNPVPGNNQWARAAYFTGNMDFYKVYPKKNYLDYINLWATNNNWTLNGGNSTRNADNQTCGQVYIDLYNLDTEKQNFKIASIKSSIDNMVNSAKADDWWWVDALYMAMPVFSRLGVLHNDNKYFDKMYQLYTNTKITRKLYNTSENLWYRDESFDPPYFTPNGEDSYWSRGNGWVIAAHVRTLQLLPENHINRNEYIETFRAMAAALKARQQVDGFWYASLDDPKDYGGPETSGTAFFTYSIAWGINNGLLDSVDYYPAIVRAWEAMTKISVQKSGLLGYVQGVGSNPASSQPVTASSTADFGVGAFLLAGTELLKLAKGEMPVPSDFFISSANAISKNRVQVTFSNAYQNSSALDKLNYSINDISINNVLKGKNDSTVILETSDLKYGSYILDVKDVLSENGEKIEDGDNKSFVFTGVVNITASGYETGTSNTPDKTMDFDFSTRWSANGAGQWILYDLGETVTVHSVELAFFNGASRLAYFSIALSDDGEKFTDVYNGASSGKTTELELFDFDDLKARYVKITGYGNSQSTWNSITETRINFTQNASGIFNIMQKQKFEIYPQPLKENIIYLNNSFSDLNTWILSDLAGRKIESGKIDANITRINLNQKLSVGTYVLSFEGKNASSVLLLVE